MDQLGGDSGLYGEHEDTRALLDLVHRMNERVCQLAEMQADMKAIRKTVVRWLVETHGGTLRDTAEALGIPKSTLHRWHSEDRDSGRGGWGW